MHKIKNISFLLVFFLAISNIYAADFAGGTGTDDDPFLISTPDHLNNVRNYCAPEHADKHFLIINDIDLDVPPYNQGEGWCQ